MIAGLDPHSVLPLALDWTHSRASCSGSTSASLAGIYALLALGLQLNVGFTGITNFGQAGFMAIGGYTMAILTVNTSISFWFALPLSMLAAIGFGLLVGLPSLRLREDYFAIATLASAELIRIVAQNAESLTGGNQGFFCNDTQTKCFDDTWLNASDKIQGWLQSAGWSNADALAVLFVVVAVVVVIVTVALRMTQNTPWGRVLRAVREDQDAARALGKNAFAYKLQSLAISAAIAAVAGWFLALDLATIHPDRLRAAGDLLRLLRAHPRRPGQLLGRDRGLGGPVDPARGHEVRRDLQRRVRHRGAAIRARRLDPDPADGVSPAGHVRQTRGDGPR